MPIVTTKRIPTDYPTLQAAVDAVHGNVTINRGDTVRLLIQSGHQLTAGLSCAYGDYGYFTIDYEGFDTWRNLTEAQRDATTMPTVTLATTFQGVSAVPFLSTSNDPEDVTDPGDEDAHLIMGYYATMPALNCVIDMGGKFDNGYNGVESCFGLIKPLAGIYRAGHDALNMRNSVCNAEKAFLKGANNHAVRVAFASNVNVQDCDGTYAMQDPDGAGWAALDVSRSSTCHARLADFSYSGTRLGTTATDATTRKGAGANIRRNSTCCLEDAKFIGCAGGSDIGGVHVQHSARSSAFRVKLDSIRTGYPLKVSNGGYMNINGASFKGIPGTYAIYFDQGAIVTMSGATGYKLSEGTTASRAIVNTDISLGQWNVPTSDGIAFNENFNAPLRLGTFSSTGASNGKNFDSSSVLQSSRNSTGNVSHVDFFNPNSATSGSRIGGINTTGTAVAFNTGSDRRLKQNDREFDSGALIDALRAIQFDWKANGKPGLGVIAQEAFEVFPDAVSLPADDSSDEMWSVDYSKFVPILLAEVKTLRQRVNALESV